LHFNPGVATAGWFELQRGHLGHATSSYLTRVANAKTAEPAGQIRRKGEIEREMGIEMIPSGYLT